jgi:sugar lactone lactonase YvrE
MLGARRFTIAVVLSFGALAAQGQSIITVAGGGTDDGHAATDVGLFGVAGLTLDSAGNLYIVEQMANDVRRVTPDGTISTIAGNGGAGFGGDGGRARRATLNHPSNVVIDTNGDIYIADHDNGRVRKVDASGIITTFAGLGKERSDQTLGDNGPASDAVLRGPFGLALARGSLYVSEDGYLGNRVRKIDLATKTITTIAGLIDGSDGFSGDGGPATAAKLNTPFDLFVDSAGNVFIADSLNDRVRRVDVATGVIDTFAGGGTPSDNIGDGGPATAAKLDSPAALALDNGGSLLILTNDRVRRVDKATGTISTVASGFGYSLGFAPAPDGALFINQYQFAVARYPAGSLTDYTIYAGGGLYVGDGLPAAAAVLRNPEGNAVDRSGNLYIADSYNLLVRKVDARTGIISTYAGNGSYYDEGVDGVPATQTAVGFPLDVAFDPQGNLFILDEGNEKIKRVDANTGILTVYAGGGNPAGGNNEGLPATSAKLTQPIGIGFDPTGNLYIADDLADKVWRVDATTHVITTFAGNGQVGLSGDGGPATAAMLNYPVAVDADAAGNVYISDLFNNVIRKVASNGTISTFAGDPSASNTVLGDGGPALKAFISPEHMTIAPNGDLYFADWYTSRIRKIDAGSGIITTVAGSGTAYYIDADFTGDNGPATDAKLNFPFNWGGVALDSGGNLFISDSANNRIRAVFACVSMAAPQLTAPANGSTNAATAPSLTWNDVPGAFRYDVRLDTVSPPVRVIASDLTEVSFAPSNLQSGTQYYWSVTAKGDQFCPSVSSAASAVSSFTTAAGCGAGAFDIIAPAEGQTGVNGSALTLLWQPSAGSDSYDFYLGAANPPPLVAAGVRQTSYATTTVDRNLFWFVVAHAACDNTKTATTPIHSFSASVSHTCGTATITLGAPASGAGGVSTSPDLTWTVSGDEAPDAFDVYFGTGTNPPLLRADLPRDARSVSVPSLETATTYFWRVVGKGVCFPGGSSTALASFTTRSACTTPGATQIIFAPATVSAGATYTIVWSVAPGLDADGGYLVERSTSASFAQIIDSQVTSSTAASFLAITPGTYVHRVLALPSCDASKSGPVSDGKSVNSTIAQPNIIFTVQPTAVVTALGERIEDRRGSFTLENIGSTPAQIIVGQSELPGSKPFFSIAEGGAFVTLQPRTPRTFTIDYSGPRNDVAGSYQGVIFAVGVTQQLAVTPYAFVNLKVGGGPAVAPQFLVNNAPTEFVAFPGFSGDDDSNRAPLEVIIQNPGTTPMELGAEIGPDVWLVPENGWNSQPLAAGASRSIRLFTRRPFAPTGSPLPRYTYFTVRTKDGATARLLVQDNDRVSVSTGRATSLDVAARSFIVPETVSQTVNSVRSVTRLRLSNSGGDSVQVELIFTPTDADGFDAGLVKRAVIVAPPNDVVTLTDPLVQVFGAADGASGQIEARIPRERLGLIAVSASTVSLAGGSTTVIPVVSRGEGARIGAPHVIYLPLPEPMTLTLAETTGIDHATIRIVTTDSSGQGTVPQDIPRYGMRRISLGAVSRIDINVDGGGGSVVAVATLTTGSSTATVLSRPLSERIGGAALARAFWKRAAPNDTVSVTTVVPVIGGTSSSGSAPTYKTALSLVAPSSAAATFNLALYPASGGAALPKSVQVPTGVSLVFNDALRDLFNVNAATDGNLFVQGPPGSKVYAVLQTAPPGGSSTPTSFIPLPTTLSEAVTSAASSSQRPLSFDGLEQSVDPTRGTRWMLLLNEVGGASGSINVRLYEAGNRSRPIAEKDFSVSANQQLKLDTIFDNLGLAAADRKKDRTNVEVVVTANSGSARVAATAVSVDNKTGDTKMVALVPAVGSGNPNVSFTAPVTSQSPPGQPRRRGVRH